MRFLRTQLHHHSGRVEIGCISSICRIRPCRPLLTEVRVSRALSTAGNPHLRTSSLPRSPCTEWSGFHLSQHFLVRTQTRRRSTGATAEASIAKYDAEEEQGEGEDVEDLDTNERNPTAVADKDSTSRDGTGGENLVERSYTGTFDELIPTQAGKEALKKSPIANHQELLNLTLFCDRTQKRLSEPGSVLRFSQFPGWRTLLPIVAERLGVHHITVTKGHPYFERASQGPVLHLLVNSGDRLPSPRDESKPIENILLGQISAAHIQHWLSELRKLPEIPHSYLMKIMMIACRYSPLAVPMLKLTQNDHQTTTEPTSTEFRRHPYRLELSNANYNVSIVRLIETDLIISPTFLADAFMDYIMSIIKVVPDNVSQNSRTVRSHWDSPKLLGKALKALDWGGFTFEDTQVHLGGLSSLDLWKVRIQTTKEGQLGPAVIWASKKYARRMAALHACTFLKSPLQSAYASGHLTLEEYEEFAPCWDEAISDDEQRKPTPLDSPALAPTFHNVQINEEIVSAMVDTLTKLMKTGFQSTYEWTSSKSAALELGPVRPTALLARGVRLDSMLYREYWKKKMNSTGVPPNLPVRVEKICLDIIKTIAASNITIIVAATGSGKTTQIPQMIFDECITGGYGSMCNIVCTQPRRVSTISVATRVASERYQSIGQEVGYKVRFDVRPTRLACGITYMTSGYLLRLLESDPLAILQSHSHIILDEVHSRDIDTDLLLTALKNMFDGRVLPEIRSMPKIVLMSATINPEFFKNYFEDLEPRVKVSTIEVPGKMYDVEEKRLDQVLAELQESHSKELTTMLENSEVRNYLDEQMQFTNSTEDGTRDNEPMADAQENASFDKVQAIPKDLLVPVPLLHLLIVRLLSSTSSGDILVFLPGLAEIEALEQLLLNQPSSQYEFANPERNRLFKLHSALYETNYAVFQPVPSGCRRVILATNIAETSITLPGVKFVVDTGLSRQATFDQVSQSGTFGLQWISKAEATQRRGRAGRTHAGVYYGTYSQAQYNAMAFAPTPEILRTSLENLVLRNAASRAFRLIDHDKGEEGSTGEVPAGQALLTAPSPPEKRFVAAAAQQLHNIRALTSNGNVTPMGQILSRLPMSPAAGKAVLLGLIFRCLDTLVVYGALREDLPIMFNPSAAGAVVDRRRILAGTNDDDKWADTQGFFLYDSQRRERKMGAAVELKESLSLRHDAYCEYAQTSKQTFETLRPMLGLSENHDSRWTESDLPSPLFPATPRSLNTNCANAELVKALAFSTSGTRFACWTHKHWKTRDHRRVLPHPKSVNHSGHRRALRAHRLRRESGDLLSYGTMRHIMKDKYPWLYDTAVATPLMAVLFAESVALDEQKSTFVVNDWVQYRLCSGTQDKDKRRTAKIIWEYRKALDRFLAHAMQMVSLEPYNLKKVRSGELSVDDFNVFFGLKDNELRDIIVNSVVKVLGIDAKDRSERIAARVLDEQGGEIKKAASDDTDQEEQESVTEPDAESESADQDEAELEDDDDDDDNDNDDGEEKHIFRIVDRHRRQHVYSPTPLNQKPKRKEEDVNLEERLQSMVKDVLSKRQCA